MKDITEEKLEKVRKLSDFAAENVKALEHMEFTVEELKRIEEILK